MREQNYLDNLVGVFGHPVAENPGVVIQEAAFRSLGLERWRFLTIDVEPGSLGDAVKGLKAMKMRGINCTIPHKIEVLKYLDKVAPSARLIGAVNTIINESGVLTGENTDGKGFMIALEGAGVDPAGKSVVVLGAGGASRAICIELALARRPKAHDSEHSQGQRPGGEPGKDPEGEYQACHRLCSLGWNLQDSR